MLHVVIQPNGCWIWTASCKSYEGTDLYGQFKYLGKMMRAHKVSYLMFKGEVPPNMLVLHTCDNPLCVNPDHLYLGDHLQNCKDRKERGREGNHKGEANGMATVTWEIVRQMRAMRAPCARTWKPSYQEIADKFHVSVGIVKNIINGYTWKEDKLDNPPVVADKSD